MNLIKWFFRFFTGKPHFYIGGMDDPYMLRWYLFPRNPFFNVYLHKFLRDDDDRAMHDHPWNFLSIMLKGCYREYRPSGDVLRTAPSIVYRPAESIHRVELICDENGNDIPCWTLVFTGPKIRVWGFWCPQGFIEWDKFVDSTDEGNIGKGCDQ